MCMHLCMCVWGGGAQLGDHMQIFIWQKPYMHNISLLLSSGEILKVCMHAQICIHSGAFSIELIIMISGIVIVWLHTGSNLCLLFKIYTFKELSDGSLLNNCSSCLDSSDFNRRPAHAPLSVISMHANFQQAERSNLIIDGSLQSNVASFCLVTSSRPVISMHVWISYKPKGL